MAQPATPSFEVRFGRTGEGEHMETLATYVVHGLVQGEISRHERIRRNMDRLSLPDGADDFRIGKRLEAGDMESYSVVLRAVADFGMVADLVEPMTAVQTAPAAGETALPSAGPLRSAMEAHEATLLFPVQSIFRTSEA